MSCGMLKSWYRGIEDQGKVNWVRTSSVRQEATEDLHKRGRTACCWNQVAGICQAVR